MKRTLLFLILAAFTTLFATGCESDDGGLSGGNSTDTVGAGDGTGGETCYSVMVNTINDGESACGIFVCTANQYCATGDFCDPGCVSELDCAKGQFCDLSNPSGLPGGQQVGLCRAPDASHEIACTPTGNNDPCGSVDGSYSVKLSSTGSAAECSQLFDDAVECNVMQDACTVTWSCGAGAIFESGELDNGNSYSFDVSLMGGTGTCEVTFQPSATPTSFTWSCSGSAGSAVVTCKGTGVQ